MLAVGLTLFVVTPCFAQDAESPNHPATSSADPSANDPEGKGDAPGSRAHQLCLDAAHSLASGETTQALVQLKRAQQRNPQNVGVITNLAELYLRLNKPRLALKNFRQAHSMNPKELVISLSLIDLLLKTKPLSSDEISEAEIVLEESRTELTRRLARLETAKRRAARQRRSRRLARLSSDLDKNKHLQSRFLEQDIRISFLARRHAEVQRYFAQFAAIASREALDETALKLGDLYSNIQQFEVAIGWYKKVTTEPEPRASALRAIAQIESKQRARLFSLVAHWVDLPESITTNVDRIQELLNRTSSLIKLETATAELEDVADVYSTVTRLQRLLGKAYMRQAQLGGAKPLFLRAEHAFLRAVALDPASLVNLRDLGDFYAARNHQKQASIYFGRALRLDPGNSELHLRYSKILENVRGKREALGAIEQAIGAVGEDHPDMRQLLKRKRDLTQAVGVIPMQVNDYLGRQFARAWSFFDRKSFGKALQEIRSVPIKERTPRLFELEGRALWQQALLEHRLTKQPHSRHKLQAAVSALQKVSTGPKDLQCQARALLAKIYEHQQRPKQAIATLRDVESCDSALATINRIRLELDPRRRPELPEWLANVSRIVALRNAEGQLENMRVQGIINEEQGLEVGRERYQAYGQPLEEELDRVTTRLRTSYMLIMSISAPLVFWLFLLSRRRFGGYDLQRFTTQIPASQADVHRILSAVRHEVLKHNTTALQGLISSIENGDDISDQAEWCRHALIGDLATGITGANERLQSYVKQLMYVAESHRRRLNLVYRDPAFRAILSGFSLLGGAEDDFRRAEKTGRASRKFLKKLRQAANEINGDGYRRLIALLKALRGLTVTESICSDVFDDVRGELGLAELDVAPLALTVIDGVLPTDLPIARQDFEDMLRNPFRNAIQATHKMGSESPILVGLDVMHEVEPITGETSLVFLVKDQCQKMIQSHLIHDQAIESGLGLMNSLISKYDGSVQVRELPAPWFKAIAISLPCNDVSAEEWAL